MDNKIKNAFDNIHADDSLKEKTKLTVKKRMSEAEKIQRPKVRKFAAAACVLVLLCGAFLSYTVPAAAVSIDVNPSLELEINIYDRVIDVRGYNSDADELKDEISVKNMKYTDAINTILASEKIAACMSEDGLIEITVAGRSAEKADQMENQISDQTGISSENIYCINSRRDIEAAHSADISFGKYRAYLELQKVNPDISLDEIRDLSMRQISDLIEQQKDKTTGGEVNLEEEKGKGNGAGSGGGTENRGGNGKQSGK